jgi:hypothetical protein
MLITTRLYPAEAAG